MEPAPLGTSQRRPRRGSIERPVDLRLVRNLAALVALPLVLAVFTMTRTGPLPAPDLPPAFDGATAAALTVELAGDNANRVPGSPGAASAARWFRDKLALYGLRTREDAWREDVPGLGPVELRNLATVVRGTLDETIVFVAHRDNNGLSAGANSDASGTAALVELARAYATAGTTESARTPLHTLVFLSTDAGAYGSLGIARFARRSPLARRAVAVVALDGLAGSAAPRLELGGLGAHSPPPVLVRTAEARVAAESGAPPAHPGFLDQLVSLGLPFGFGAQAPVLGSRIPALRLTTAADSGTPPGGDEIATLDRARLTQLGRASETLLTSLDAAVELPTATGGALFVGERAVRGWALELLLLVAVVPFAGAALDLLSRCRRRRLALAPAWRALRRRFGLWLVLGGLLGVVVVALVWLRARARLIPRARARPEEDLAAYATAFVALLGVAGWTALVSPYSLVFVLPSLYAWLTLPQLRSGPSWVTDVVFGIGLLGPVLALVVLAQQLELGLRAPLYAASLLTTGVVPWGATFALIGWASVASFVGAIAAGRYAAPSGR